MSPILILGRNGQVGYELARTLTPLAQVVALDRAEADLAEPHAVADRVLAIGPSLVVNAAAYTAVDRAEAEEGLATRVNADAPAAIAGACRQVGARLIHYSTDYVFDGAGTVPYREEDPTGPLGAYGRSKLAGEQAVLAADARHLVLRLAWVYGTRGRNFMLTMLRLAREGRPLRVVNDQVGSPSWSRAIAEVTAHAALRLITEPDAEGGLYHLGSSGETSWCGFAREIVSGAFGDEAPEVTPITTAEFPTPATRPKYSVLNSDRFRRRFGVGLPDWRDQLKLALEDSR